MAGVFSYLKELNVVCVHTCTLLLLYWMVKLCWNRSVLSPASLHRWIAEGWASDSSHGSFRQVRSEAELWKATLTCKLKWLLNHSSSSSLVIKKKAEIQEQRNNMTCMICLGCNRRDVCSSPGPESPVVCLWEGELLTSLRLCWGSSTENGGCVPSLKLKAISVLFFSWNVLVILDSF